MTTDYERGFAAGRMAGLEDASEVAAAAGYEQTALRILALRTPSPAPSSTAHSEPMRCGACGVTIKDSFTWTFDGRTLCRACERAPSPEVCGCDGQKGQGCTICSNPFNHPIHSPHGHNYAAPTPKEDATRCDGECGCAAECTCPDPRLSVPSDHPRSPASDAAAGGRCPECGAELNADDLEMARRRYAFRPGQVNNLGGWAVPITETCGSCGTGRSPSTGGDK